MPDAPIPNPWLALDAGADPVERSRQVLVAIFDPLHRPTCGHSREHDRALVSRDVRLLPEAATHIRGHDAQVRLRRVILLVVRDRLRGRG